MLALEELRLEELAHLHAEVAAQVEEDVCAVIAESGVSEWGSEGGSEGGSGQVEG